MGPWTGDHIIEVFTFQGVIFVRFHCSAALTKSVRMPTTKKSPCSLAFSKKSTWPICTRGVKKDYEIIAMILSRVYNNKSYNIIMNS